MKITKDEIDVKEIAGETKEGEPVVYIATKGGLHAFFSKDESGSISALGAAPHKAIAKFLSDKKHEGIKWKDDFLTKSHVSEEQETFNKLRKFMFLKTEEIEQNPNDVYIVYDTSKSEISLMKHEDIRKGNINKYALIRDLACTIPATPLCQLTERFALEKMSRPRITFPKLGMDNRPDQNVQVIESNKQKEMYGRKVANNFVPNQGMYSNQASRDKNAKTVSGAFNRNTVGRSVLSNPHYTESTGGNPRPKKSFEAALGGDLRSKFEEVTDLAFKEKKLKVLEQNSAAATDHHKEVQKWRDEAMAIDRSTPEGMARFRQLASNPPQKPKKLRQPSVPKVKTKDLSPNQMKRRGQSVGATIEHEGFHGLLHGIDNKYGKGSAAKIVDKLHAQHDPAAIASVENFIAKELNYKPSSPKFKEEALAHARDILVNTNKREKYKKFTGSSADEHIKKLKVGHDKAYRFAQNLSSVDGASQSAAMPMAAEQVKKSLDLVHYSTNDNLSEVDPNKMGSSGVGGSQYKRGLPETKSSFFYTAESKPEDLVTQKAPHKYAASLDSSHKIYDYTNDPEKMIAAQKTKNGGAWNEDMFHGMIKEKGYHGVKWKMRDGTDVVQMYHPVKVKKV